MCSNNTTLIYPSRLQYNVMSSWYSASGVACLICNFVIAKVFCSNDSLKSDHKLVVALAVSDCFAGIQGLQRAFASFYPFCTLTSFQCAFHEIPLLVYASSKYLLVLALSSFRLIGVERPLTFKRLIEKKIHIWFYVAVISYSLTRCIITIIDTWGREAPVQMCTIGSLPERPTYRYMALICMLLICTANLRLYVVLRRRSTELIDNPPAIKAARMSKTLIITSFVFVMTTVCSTTIYYVPRFSR